MPTISRSTRRKRHSPNSANEKSRSPFALQNAAAVAAAHLAYFGDHRPTSTTVGVNALFFPGQLLEINFIVDTRLPA